MYFWLIRCRGTETNGKGETGSKTSSHACLYRLYLYIQRDSRWRGCGYTVCLNERILSKSSNRTSSRPGAKRLLLALRSPALCCLNDTSWVLYTAAMPFNQSLSKIVRKWCHAVWSKKKLSQRHRSLKYSHSATDWLWALEAVSSDLVASMLLIMPRLMECNDVLMSR
jgi:hypothetical protein